MSFDVDKNMLLVKQKLYSGDESEIKIHNMPAGKLFHIAIATTQTSTDVYVNGFLHTHKTLDSLPLTEPSAHVQVGPGGGWKGMIGSFTYYNYALSPDEVRTLAATKAVPDPNALPPNPPYFDTTWWIGRR